jgi:hypothetical protein
MQQLLIPVSPGELIDRITVLEIKAERITDKTKLVHIRPELAAMRRILKEHSIMSDDIQPLREQLREVNETLWEIEDYLRIKESEQAFDDQFIDLARSQYRNNDRRAELKRRIDEAVESDFVEEKSYPAYSAV